MSIASHFSFSNFVEVIDIIAQALDLLIVVPVENMIVLMFTLDQAVIVLYAIHWYTATVIRYIYTL